MEADDRLLLPILQPEMAGNPFSWPDGGKCSNTTSISSKKNCTVLWIFREGESLHPCRSSSCRKDIILNRCKENYLVKQIYLDSADLCRTSWLPRRLRLSLFGTCRDTVVAAISPVRQPTPAG